MKSISNKISELSSGALSDKEERLLHRYFDGEASALQSFFVKQLLRRNSAAQTYLDLLERSAAAARDYFSEGASVSFTERASANLWQRIDARITQEERSMVLLGQRRLALSRAGLTKDVGYFGSSRWASWPQYSALAVSLAVLVFVGVNVFHGKTPTGSMSEQLSGHQQALAAGENLTIGVQDAGNAALAPVSFEQNSAGQQVDSAVEQGQQPADVYFSIPPQEENLSPRAMEVDWMRSKGHVLVLQPSSQKGAILWVAQNSPWVDFSGAASATDVKSSKVKFKTLPDVHLLNEHIPDALSVADR